MDTFDLTNPTRRNRIWLGTALTKEQSSRSHYRPIVRQPYQKWLRNDLAVHLFSMGGLRRVFQVAQILFYENI